MVIDLSKSYGTPSAKLRITSLNPSSPATILSTTHGIYVSAAAGAAKGLGIQIDHLIVKSSGGSGHNGIYLLAPAGIRLDTLVVDSVDVSLFEQGMQTSRAGSSVPFMINVLVSNSKFHGNKGAGVIIGGTAGAAITGCESYSNGWNGPGISGTDSDLMAIINCNSHDNKGMGFTMAEGMANSVITGCQSKSNYYSAYVVIGRNQINANNGGGVNNVVIKDSSSTNDGNGYKTMITGIWTDGIVAATNVAFQNLKVVNSASGVATSYFGSGKEFDALWLAGTFTATVQNSVYTFPSATYSDDLACDSSRPFVCKSNHHGKH